MIAAFCEEKREITGGCFLEIRYAASMNDPLKISKVYEESWKYAYKGLIPQDYLDMIPAGRWTSGIGEPNRKTLVCVEEGRIVGTSSFCGSRFVRFGFSPTSDFLETEIGGKALREVRYIIQMR